MTGAFSCIVFTVAEAAAVWAGYYLATVFLGALPPPRRKPALKPPKPPPLDCFFFYVAACCCAGYAVGLTSDAGCF